MSHHHHLSAFKDWLSEHSKSYADDSEHLHRLEIWVKNHEFIQRHNAEYEQGSHSFTVGHNEYSDLTSHEFAGKLKGFLKHLAKLSGIIHHSSDTNGIPDSVDWRQEGYVNAIQNQGQCGSCYAFSGVAAIEGQYFKATGTLLKLSEQNIVDCSTTYGNNGCGGGTMDNVFNYVKENGICTEDSYPYQAQEGESQADSATKSPVQVTGYTDIPHGDEGALTNAIATVGPVSVAIDASQRSFQLYKSGIYDDPSCTQHVDHAVLAVGYGSDNGQDYYIIRNSWGTTWGEEGYVRFARNKNNFGGIATMASYPLV